ncbi:MAG: hypothetical protein ACRDNS_09440 [Trebonia sp.]
MAIVWPCPLSVDANAAAGRAIEVPRGPLPIVLDDHELLWGFYTRYLRIGEIVIR